MNPHLKQLKEQRARAHGSVLNADLLLTYETAVGLERLHEKMLEALTETRGLFASPEYGKKTKGVGDWQKAATAKLDAAIKELK